MLDDEVKRHFLSAAASTAVLPPGMHPMDGSALGSIAVEPELPVTLDAGSADESAADVLLDALDAHKYIALAHETDAASGGCELSVIKRRTPEALRPRLYDGEERPAVVPWFAGSCHGDSFRHLSVALLARSLGAVERKLSGSGATYRKVSGAQLDGSGGPRLPPPSTRSSHAGDDVESGVAVSDLDKISC